jgi:hypothetical protein
MKNKGWLACLLAVLVLSACSGTPKYNEYYVSIQGSDTSGNGTSGKPWRTIQYALDHAKKYGNSTIRINLAKGIYNENIVIDHAVVIRGAGSSQTVSTGTNPLIPVQNVSVIVHQKVENIPWYENYSVYAKGAGEVHLENLNVFGGMVYSNDSDFSIEHVIVNGVNGWNPDKGGIYGVRVTKSSFSINNSRIQTGTNVYADLGLQITDSSGFVNNTYLGNGFDHVISINTDLTNATSVQYNLPPPKQIYITGVTIEGSSVYWADGIRIQAPFNVVVQDTKITRAAGGDPASAGVPHDVPYAGIELAFGMVASEENEMRRVEVLNVQTSGFDVGIGVNLSTLELKVQNSIIHGITYDVQSFYKDLPDQNEPTVDFGGGPLGSKGENNFSNQPKYAYYHDPGTYLVYACYNIWNVPTPQIDWVRIYDQLDKPSLGRVQWDCSASGNATSQSGLTLVTSIPTPTTRVVAIPKDNINCRAGNSSTEFEVVDFLLANTAYTPLGRGPDNQWLYLVGPSGGRNCWVYMGSIRLVEGVDVVEIADIPEDVLPIIAYPAIPTETATPEPVERDTAVPTACGLRSGCP